MQSRVDPEDVHKHRGRCTQTNTEEDVHNNFLLQYTKEDVHQHSSVIGLLTVQFCTWSLYYTKTQNELKSSVHN